jgi:hypothetical protein
LYKGERLNKIKIMSAVNSSCRFVPVENATWIIFAQRSEGTLSLGFCSGSHIQSKFFHAQCIQHEIESFKGYKNRNSFAVFQIDVNSNFSIAAIKQLKKFQNGKLNRFVFSSMQNKLTFANNGEKPLAKPSRIVLVCFFYQQRRSEQNFVTFNDL